MVKAQMKIQQMAFMLLAITIFFSMVGLLLLNVKVAGLKGDVDLIREKNALTLAMSLVNSPELSCGNAFGTAKSNCIDMDKAMALKKNIDKYKTRPLYNFWGREVNIEIRRLFPASGSVECDSRNYPNCDFIRMFEDKGGFSSPNFVLLCRKANDAGRLYDKCEIGSIRVSYVTTNQ